MQPLIVVNDVASTRALLALSVAAALYLTVARLSQWTFGDLDVAALVIVAFTPLQLWYGSRTIEFYRDRLVVIRRGVVRVDRSFDDLLAIRKLPFLDIVWLVFSGPERVVLFATNDSWNSLIEACRRAHRARGGRA